MKPFRVAYHYLEPLLLIALVICSYAYITPRWQGVSVQTERGTSSGFTLPLNYGEIDWAIAVLSIDTGRIYPQSYRMIPDDCITDVRINDREMDDAEAAVCDYANGKLYKLGPDLEPGRNVVTVWLKNHGGPGGLQVQTNHLDPLYLILHALLACGIGWLLLQIRRDLSGRAWPVSLWLALGFGLVMRFIYLIVTPPRVRANDVDGHLDYIRFMMEHWAIPAAKDGWSYFHPPLYYLMSAMGFEFMNWINPKLLSLTTYGQIQSLLLMVITVPFAIAMSRLIFNQPKDTYKQVLLSLLFAVFPGILLFTSHINNDVLMFLLNLTGVYFVMRWYYKTPGRWHHWFVIGTLLIALSVISKANGILVYPFVGLCLLLKPGLSWRKRISLGLVCTALFVVTNGYVVYKRTIVEKQSNVVGNLATINSGLKLTNEPQNYYIFNPVRIIKTAYANPWDDDLGRQYFWEFLYKCAFTGEAVFSWKWLLQTQLVLGLILLLYAIWGTAAALRRRWRHWLPIISIPIVITLAHMLHTMNTPYASSQHFRFSVMIILPLAALTLHGIANSQVWLRRIGYGLYALLVLASTVFISSLLFLGN